MHVQWWLPLKKTHTQRCKVVLKVEMQLIEPNAMVDIDFIVFSFPAKKNKTMNNITMINDMHVNRVKANIDVANEVNYM